VLIYQDEMEIQVRRGLPGIPDVSGHAFDFSPRKFGLIFTIRRHLEARRLLKWPRSWNRHCRTF
jgi:hypothetical protein